MASTDPTTLSSEEQDEEAELLAMRERVQAMEAEAAKLREMQQDGSSGTAQTAAPAAPGSAAHPTEQEKEEVDYGATPEEIQQHFQSCGTINRVTILCDKFTGHPKGYAYVEFSDPSLVGNAMALNESLFRGRLLKVTAKRTNLPFMSARGRGRGRGARGGFRARGRPFRGRGRGGYY